MTKTSAGTISTASGMPVASQPAGPPTAASTSWIRRLRTISGAGTPIVPNQNRRARSASALGAPGAVSGEPTKNSARQARPRARATPDSR